MALFGRGWPWPAGPMEAVTMGFGAMSIGSASGGEAVSAKAGRAGGRGVVAARTCSAFTARDTAGRVGCAAAVAGAGEVAAVGWKEEVGSDVAEALKPCVTGRR